VSESAEPCRLEQRGRVGGLIACVEISSELSGLPGDLSRHVFDTFGAPFDAPSSLLRHIGGTALDAPKPIFVNLSKIDAIDQQPFGPLLMLRKLRRKRGGHFKCAAITTKAHSAFRRNGFDFRLQQ
jgi:hypothetical protein